MDLRTGRLLWPALSEPLVACKPLGEDWECEVLVMGAGISGAFAACLLAEAGVKVLVVDKRGVAKGSTPASTALVQYELDTPLVELRKLVGREVADAAYVGCRGALDRMVEVAGRMGVACDLKEHGSLFLAKDLTDAEWFGEETRARAELGIEVELLSRRKLRDRFGIERAGAIYSERGIELDPYKLVQGLMRAAVGMGARVVRDEVQAAEVKGGGHCFLTENGRRIVAKQVVVATGYETPEEFGGVRRYCTLKSTYAVASEVMGREVWPERALIWESGSPYFYARQTADGRLIVGGEDEGFVNAEARDALLPGKVELLVAKFGELWPGVEMRPEYWWAGTFGESEDGMPLIGKLEQYPGCWFALGYGGNGLTFALLAGEIIRDGILGRRNALAGVFGFGRSGLLADGRGGVKGFVE